jgi:hypothetical protein
MKPAIFIDAYLSSNEREQAFHKNVNNFIDAGYDLFIISNKISNFDKFDKVKYFEYDSRNRLLKDRSSYITSSDSDYFHCSKKYNFYGSSEPHVLFTCSPIFNTTNLSVLYNTRRICEIAKEFGYTNVFRVEYDCIFDRYDFENTFLKGYETEDWNNYGLAGSGCFGVYTNWIYLNVDYFISKIPLIQSDYQYKDFIYKNFGELKYLTFEKILYRILNKIKILTNDEARKCVGINTNTFTSDQTYNRFNFYSGKLIVVSTNDHTRVLLDNEYNEEINVTIVKDTNVESIIMPRNTFYVFNIQPNQYVCIKHKEHVKVIDTTSTCVGKFTLLSESADPNWKD